MLCQKHDSAGIPEIIDFESALAYQLLCVIFPITMCSQYWRWFKYAKVMSNNIWANLKSNLKSVIDSNSFELNITTFVYRNLTKLSTVMTHYLAKIDYREKYDDIKKNFFW